MDSILLSESQVERSIFLISSQLAIHIVALFCSVWSISCGDSSPPTTAFLLLNYLCLCCAYICFSPPPLLRPSSGVTEWVDSGGICDYLKKRSSIHPLALMVSRSKLCSWVLGPNEGFVKL